MTFPQFAFKNITRNARSYMAFYLSSSFAVMIFFMFAMFIFHPALETGYMNNVAKKGMVFAEWTIFAFSILFILYSVSAFLKTRKKELGILSIQGASPKQLRLLITLENVVIGLASVITGIIGGIILAKLFFTAGAYILEMKPLQLYFPWKALGLTAVVFLVLFVIISQFTLYIIHSESTLSLLKGSDKPKKEPKASIFFSILGVLFLGAGFGLALIAGIDMASAAIIFVCTVIGTYLFYSQLSVWVLKLIKRNKRFYRKGTNLLLLSDLTYRVKDNARLFFIVTIVSAIAFTATGTLTTYKSMFSVGETPFETEFFSRSSNAEEAEQLASIQQQLQQENGNYQQSQFTVMEARHGESDYPVLIVSYEDWIEAFPELGTPALKDGEGIYYGETTVGEYEILTGNSTKVNTDSQQMPLNLLSIEKPMLQLGDVLVVNEQSYETLKHGLVEASLYGFQYDNWKNSLELNQNIHSQIVGETYNPDAEYYSKAIRYFESIQLPSLSLFIGLFIALVFFLASGSFLYFRLFTDLYEDRKKYKSLAKIGLSEKEMAKNATLQIAILFFLPFGLAVIDTAFALRVLQREGGYENVLQSGMVTILGFLLLQVLFFFIIRSRYIKHLKEYVYK